MKILNIVGARPNFMKIAPLIESMNKYPNKIIHKLIHTGQHYDDKMSKSFFNDLNIPIPDINLCVGSGSHAYQTAKVMIAFEKVCLNENPDLVVVVGDVNSTLACAITAKKMGIKVAHVEAGLRSNDMNMPEEINRICTDAISDYLFTTDCYANENLFSEGIGKERVFFVGNVMIDTLIKHRDKAENLTLINKIGLNAKSYALLTLHRPANVDNKKIFGGIIDALNVISRKIPIVFPIHPRAKKMAEKYGLLPNFNSGDSVKGIWITEPLGYLDFLHLTINANFVITDSGGLQEETTVLGIPCITIRNNTERPITCKKGTNILAGNTPDNIIKCAEKMLNENISKYSIPDKWDGKAADRIVEILLNSWP